MKSNLFPPFPLPSSASCTVTSRPRFLSAPYDAVSQPLSGLKNRQEAYYISIYSNFSTRFPRRSLAISSLSSAILGFKFFWITSLKETKVSFVVTSCRG
ncbi:hypothetical protein GYMLUDRAFT_830293 [Collybiopsis luxurians FD-317 M1]|uniref:Uncharacterized protein n=1 Tax=Collybiopsis luxurians FD-317 M1 TaxID=944289 RepID=A0A0D0CL61_9AGAR|nr:hypothetical protein GYMLUDRAFT_830293 [Collybiopsis luxurians FD-317 M1]